MPDIYQDVPIIASKEEVFAAVATPKGLASWWASEARGTATLGSEFELQFGPDFSWRVKVTKFVANSEFEIEMKDSDGDWNGTRVGFRLEEEDDITWMQFHHVGWPELNEHYRRSCYCWAMYFKCLKMYVENDETVPYEDRFDA